MPRRYVVYRRVSTKKQGDSGLGLEAQDRDTALYLANYSEKPWNVVGTFTDVESGANGDRPELRKAIAQAKQEKATLLVAKLDRLSRRVSFIAALMDDPKLDLRVAQMPFADKFQLHIYAALAEQEREFISKRTTAALAEARARREAAGLPNNQGGLRDATMKRNESVRANAEARARKIQGIVVPLRESGKSLRNIAAELNMAEIATARGGSWQPAQVARVLERLRASQGA